jgi:hypothetical protein
MVSRHQRPKTRPTTNIVGITAAAYLSRNDCSQPSARHIRSRVSESGSPLAGSSACDHAPVSRPHGCESNGSHARLARLRRLWTTPRGSVAAIRRHLYQLGIDLSTVCNRVTEQIQSFDLFEASAHPIIQSARVFRLHGVTNQEGLLERAGEVFGE